MIQIYIQKVCGHDYVYICSFYYSVFVVHQIPTVTIIIQYIIIPLNMHIVLIT